MIDEKRVYTFIDDHTLRCGAETRFIDLVSEIGEVGKELLKGTDYNSKELHLSDAMKSEIGDCLFSLFALCQELQIDPEEALANSLAKYKKRFEQHGSIGSGK